MADSYSISDFDFQSDFLHNLAVHRLFQCLADFCITCDEGIGTVAAVGWRILREQQAVAISDGDNDAWADHRIGECAAGRALHRTFISGRVHLGSAAAAVGVVCVPGVDLVAGDAGESEPSRNGAAQNQCVFIFPDIKFRKLRAAQFIVIGFVDTEQKFCFSRISGKTGAISAIEG